MIRPFGEAALLAEVDDGRAARSLASSLTDRPIEGVTGIVPGRASVLVELDPDCADAVSIERALVERARSAHAPPGGGRRRTIPVRYGRTTGPDLERVARDLGRSPTEIAELHAATELEVLFLGFAPGFAYLGDLPAALDVPRLATPRTRTPAGSVAIADGLSGIYPATLPGGWSVIGATPRMLWDAERTPPSYLLPGDLVRWVPITDDDAWEAARGAAPDW